MIGRNTFALFWIALGICFVLLLAGCAQNSDNGPASGANQYVPGSNYNPQNGANNETGGLSSAPSVPGLPAYSMSDIASHASPSDCWLVINGSIYNFSNSPLVSGASGNPAPSGNGAPSGSLASLCGTDATSSIGPMMRAPGNFSRNGTRGNYTGGTNGSYKDGTPGGRMNGTRGPGAYGANGAGGYDGAPGAGGYWASNPGAGDANRTGMDGFGRMLIGKLEN